MFMNISILGAGAMGSALCVPFADRGYTVSLWCTEFDQETHRALSEGRPHPKLDGPLPDGVRLYAADQMEDALRGADLVVLGVSTNGVLPVLKQVGSVLADQALLPPVLSVAKGFVSLDGQPAFLPTAMRRTLEVHRPDAECMLLHMAGPSIAGEVVRRAPTAVCLTGSPSAGLQNVCALLSTPAFQLEVNEDLRGVEVCLGMKNVYALSLAWPAGLTAGDEVPATRNNLKAMLMLQVRDEVIRLVSAHGGGAATVHGPAGLGDLIATAGGGRNGRFGSLLAEGHSTDTALKQLQDEGVETIEGLDAVPHAVACARDLLGDGWADLVPLLNAIRQVTRGERSVPDVVEHLHEFRNPNRKTL